MSKKLKVWMGLLFLNGLLVAQTTDRMDAVNIDGTILNQIITDEGDTLLIAQLDDISVTSPRKFASREDYLLYLKYRYYANSVYPYATEAIRIFQETEYATENMKNKERKKYIKKLQKELKEEFEDPLKNLTKTQGKVLVKMIERHMDTPMHDLIKSLRGGFTASYWSSMSRFYGYHLKDGYSAEEDPILDAVLQDFDLTHSF